MPSVSIPPELQEMIDNPKRLKVVSDGTINGTRIFNADGSKFEPPVEKITIEIDALSGVAKMTMVIIGVELDLQMAAGIEVRELET